MMGKTHLAGALAAWSLLLPTTLKQMDSHATLIMGAGLGAALVGGILPDIDQPGSTIDQDLFGPLGKTRIGAMAGGIVLLLLSFILRSPNALRQMITSPVLLGLIEPYSKWISLFVGVLGAVLLVISTLKHRGVTHTLVGMGAFIWGLDTLINFVNFLAPSRVSILISFGVGYLMGHLCLDLISDGVPLLYPFIRERIRLPISIKTDSFLDNVVCRYGLLALAAYRIVGPVWQKVGPTVMPMYHALKG